MGTPQWPVESQYWTAALPEHSESFVVQVPWHDATPPSATQVEFMQATAAPQFPFPSHVCRPCAEH
jgi:hypothetical protein